MGADGGVADVEDPGGQDAAEEPEEANAAKPMRDPGQPTQAERDAHEATHLPFRIWCADCVAGRRDNPAHKKVPADEPAKPEVLMDYCFFRREKETETVTILIVKDRHSRAIRAVPLRHKGVVLEESVDRALDAIKGFGHRGSILLKTDNEAALQALREAVANRLPEGALAVNPPARESESSGSVENAVKLFKGMLRTLLMAFERKLGGVIPSDHPAMTWLCEHVSDVATKYLRGNDGRTGYERLFGKQVHEECLEYGEQVMWRRPRKKDYNVVIDPRWSTGIWLGRTWGSISHRIAVSPTGHRSQSCSARAQSRTLEPRRNTGVAVHAMGMASAAGRTNGRDPADTSGGGTGATTSETGGVRAEKDNADSRHV